MLIRKAQYIQQREGWDALVKRAFLFLARSIFDHETYYIWENTEGCITHFMPKVEDFTIKIVSTPEELNELIAEGFDINPYIDNNFDIDEEEIKKRIKQGAMLFCAFVNKEIANVDWIAFTEEAKKYIDAVPYYADFETEACVGGAETIPKYQHLGFHTYTCSLLCQFVYELGLTSKSSTSKNNTAANKTNPKNGYSICGKMSYWRFLLREYWRGKPFKETQ